MCESWANVKKRYFPIEVVMYVSDVWMLCALQMHGSRLNFIWLCYIHLNVVFVIYAYFGAKYARLILCMLQTHVPRLDMYVCYMCMLQTHVPGPVVYGWHEVEAVTVSVRYLKFSHKFNMLCQYIAGNEHQWTLILFTPQSVILKDPASPYIWPNIAKLEVSTFRHDIQCAVLTIHQSAPLG